LEELHEFAGIPEKKKIAYAATLAKTAKPNLNS
jgi:hypothetical protein